MDMNTIIYDARRIKAYGKLQELGTYAEKDSLFIETLWRELLSDGELMVEFIYYLDHHCLLDAMKCEGYGLTDLYVWLLGQYNLMQDYGKNMADCNKEAMVLDTFYEMAEMKRNPAPYVQRLQGGMGMDRM